MISLSKGSLIVVATFVSILLTVILVNPGFRRFDETPTARFSAPPSYPTLVHRADLVKNDVRQPVASFYSSPDHVVGFQKVSSFKVRPLWKLRPFNFGIHTASKASPAIDASGIYVGSDGGIFYKIDFSGNKVWEFLVGDADLGIHSTALLDQDFVYFAAYNGFLYCLKKDTGELVYSKKVGDSIGASIVMHGSNLLLNVEVALGNGYVAKVRASDGEVLWKSDWLGGQSHSTPSLDLNSKTIVVGTNASTIVGLDLDVGTTKWVFNTKREVKTTAPVINGVVYYGSWDENLYALKAATGELVYQKVLGQMINSNVAFDPQSGAGFLAHGTKISGINLESGEKIWEFETGIRVRDTIFSTGALVTDSNGRGGLLITCSDTEMCILDSRTGQVISRLEIGYINSSMPVIFEGKAYIANDSVMGLWALEF